MKFDVGKFYTHIAGRSIAVLAEIKTYRWDKVFVIEETDNTGHGISCVEVGDEDLNDQWTEIGKEEFMRNFNNVQPISTAY